MISKMLIMNTPLEQRFSPLVSSCKTGSGVKALSMKKIISLFIGFLVGTVALPFLVLILEFSFLKIKGREELFQQVSAPEGQKQESKNEKKSPIREELELKLEITKIFSSTMIFPLKHLFIRLPKKVKQSLNITK